MPNWPRAGRALLVIPAGRFVKSGAAQRNPRQNEGGDVASGASADPADRGTLARLDDRRAVLHHPGLGAAPLSRRGGALEVRVRRLDGGHVRLRRAHAGGPVARQPVAHRTARRLRGTPSLLQRGLLDPGDGDRGPAAAAARRLPGRDAAAVGRRGRQSDAVVRHSGRRHPVLGGDRAPGRVPIAGEREGSRAGGVRAAGCRHPSSRSSSRQRS